MFFCLEKKILHFKQPAGTSRGVYTERKIWLIHLSDGEHEGIGECAPLPDLSCDALPDETYEAKLRQFCEAFTELTEFGFISLIGHGIATEIWQGCTLAHPGLISLRQMNEPDRSCRIDPP